MMHALNTVGAEFVVKAMSMKYVPFTCMIGAWRAS